LKAALVDLDNKVMPDFVPRELAAAGIAFVARDCGTRDDLAAVAGDAEIVWLLGGSKILNGNLDVLPACGAIVRTGSGTDNVPVAEATARDILVANTPAAVAETVADHALAMMLALARQLLPMDRAVRGGPAHSSYIRPRFEFGGKKVGLVGFGHIARLLARRLSGFDVTVMAYDPYVDAAAMSASGVRKEELAELLSQADYISVHCPLSERTFHLIGERELQSMKPTAILVNTARGALIDEPALIQALQSGRIAGAGLDVFEDESADVHPALRAMDNVVLSPHLAGLAEENILKRWTCSVETVIDLAVPRVPRSCVNPEVKTHWKLPAHDGARSARRTK
jgi:D-3-phosphoglycerate dehydrogenase